MSSEQPPTNAFARLIRSMSVRKAPPVAASPSQTVANGEITAPGTTVLEQGNPPPTNTEATQSTSTTGSRPPSPPPTAFQKFVNLVSGRSFGQSSEGTEFPPREWFEEERPQSPPAGPAAANAPSGPLLSSTPGRNTSGPNGILSADTDLNSRRPAYERAGSSAVRDVAEAEPMTLAQKITALMSTMSPSEAALTATPPLQSSAEGSHEPPSPDTPLADSRLAALLSSATVMNGSSSGDRKSVWDILDRMRSPSSNNDKGKQPETSGPGSPPVLESADESIMMYSPLLPNADSRIQLAEIETVFDNREHFAGTPPPGPVDHEDIPEDLDAQNHQEIPLTGDTSDAAQSEAPKWQATWSKIKDTAQEKIVAPIMERQHTREIWVPSATEISFQSTWWGYRLYLPPPVLDILSNKQLKATQRATMITTSLKWFIDRLPVNVLPVQFRAPASMIKRLSPYLGYIGTFISWSWGAIRSFDKGFLLLLCCICIFMFGTHFDVGHGVILTATWLLPVALVPSSWDINEIPVRTVSSPATQTAGPSSRDVPPPPPPPPPPEASTSASRGNGKGKKPTSNAML